MSGDIIREESMTDLWNVWFSELHQNRVGLTIKVKRLLYSGESPFQRIDILDTYEFGKMLVLYGSIMITEKDEFIYHEMLGHVPLFTHPDPKQVLVIGGGDGGTVRETLKHPEVERVTMVEIDEMVVRKCQEYFPEVAGQISNPRTRLLFADGEKYLSSTQEKFDVISVMLILLGQLRSCSRRFHQMAYDRLNDDGIFFTQSESLYFHQRTFKKLHENCRDILNSQGLLGLYPDLPQRNMELLLLKKDDR